MTKIRFYHLQKSPLERVLPQLLEKVLAKGDRAVVMAGSEERVEALNTLLWTYAQQSFLPHGSTRDGNDPEVVSAARERWKDYTQTGHSVAYWQQDARGGWEKKG